MQEVMRSKVAQQHATKLTVVNGDTNTAPALAFWRQFKGVDFPDITAEQIAGRTHRVRFGLVADRRSVPYELIEGGGESRVLSG